jgi:hypothetical protein
MALHRDQDLVRQWIGLADALSLIDTGVAAAFMYKTPKAIRTLGEEAFFRWGNLALDALKTEQRTWKAVKAYLAESLDQPNLSQWEFFLKQSVKIARVSITAAEALLQYGYRICSDLGRSQQALWINRGLEGNGSKDELVQYFSGALARAVAEKKALQTYEKLADRINLLFLVCEANLGRPVHIQSNSSLTGVAGFGGGAATDGKIVYLPDSVPSFGLYKLMALHQSMIPDTLQRLEVFEKASVDPVHIHTETDRRLLERLPGMRKEMNHQSAGTLPESYPRKDIRTDLLPLPWWGDILLELIKRTEETVSRLKQKAMDHMDCTPEVVEGMVTSMMAKGQREDEALWETLRSMFNVTGLSACELGKVPPDASVF